jgi:hypothetical protein
MTNRENFEAPELRDVTERLRTERPELTALELDATKQRILARAATPARKRTTRGAPMKSRLAILLMLVLGMTMSTAGAGLAISGTVNGNAAQQQYPPKEDGRGDVLGEEDSGAAPEQDVAGEEDTAAQPEQPAAQAPRQVEAGVQSAGDDELPFTGFAAIPILLLGIVMTVSGALLRRRISRDG